MTPYVTHRYFKAWLYPVLFFSLCHMALTAFLLWAYEDLNRRYQQPHITNIEVKGPYTDLRIIPEGWQMKIEKPPMIEERNEVKKPEVKVKPRRTH